MQQVYADPTLPYSEKAVFDIPKGFDFCQSSDSIAVNGIEDVYE